jgi:hypothetical protein
MNAQLNSTFTAVSEENWFECLCLFQAMSISGMREKHVREKISKFITRDVVQSHGDLGMAVNVYQWKCSLLQMLKNNQEVKLEFQCFPSGRV